MELRRVRAGSLRPHPANWRTHPPAQRDALRGVLAEIGYADALLARVMPDGSLELIDGHLRAETTPEQEVPVLVVDLNDAEAGTLLAALDPLAAMAGADGDKLDELLRACSIQSPSVKAMLDDLARRHPPASTEVVEDEAPEPLPAAVTRPGDLWLLGEHRLVCGDSTREQDVDRLMAGRKAALVATDPPYLVDYTGERPSSRPGAEGGKDWSAVYREVDIADAEGFMRSAWTQVLRVLAPHAALYCWHAHKRQALIARVWEELGILEHQQIVWVKPTPVFGRVFWHFRHEPCMMGWPRGSMPAFDSDHRFDSVWEVDWEGKSRVVGNEHPTQKPLELFARPIRKHTRPGDLVYEPFSGSGSQLIAAEQLGRTCYAMELEPAFVDVAVRRWQTQTRREAVLEGTGKTWLEIAAERGVTPPPPARSKRAKTSKTPTSKAPTSTTAASTSWSPRAAAADHAVSKRPKLKARSKPRAKTGTDNTHLSKEHADGR